MYNKKNGLGKIQKNPNHKISCDIPLKSTKDIENPIEKLNISIHEVARFATPVTKRTEKVKQVTTSISEKIIEKRRLRKIWQNTRKKSDKTELNKAIKELKKSIVEDKKNSIKRTLKTCHLHKKRTTHYGRLLKNLNTPRFTFPQ